MENIYVQKIRQLQGKTNLSFNGKSLEEDDIKDIAKALRHTHFTKVDLSNCNLGCDSLKYFVDCLRDTKIIELSLRGNKLQDRGARYLVEVLNDTKIKNIDLSGNLIDFEDNVDCLADALKLTQVHKLDLSGNNIGCHGLKHLAEVLNDTKIVDLDLSSNKFSNQGLMYLANVLNNTTIQNLSLDYNKMAFEGNIRSFAEALKYTQITYLHISLNQIGCDNLKYLADVLKDTQITHLNLRKNNLKNEGIIYLANALKNSRIILLNLTGNKITFEAAEYLNSKITDTTVKEFYLDVYYAKNSQQFITQISYNKFDDVRIRLTDSGIGLAGSKYMNNSFGKTGIAELNFRFHNCNKNNAGYLSKAFKNIQISNFILLPIELTHSDIMYLIEIFGNSRIGTLNLSSMMKVTDVGFLAEFLKKIKILSLNISSNNLTDESLRILAPALKNNDIIDLNLSKNNITSEGVKYLSEVLQDTKIVSINLSSCKIGSDGASYFAKTLLHSQVTQIICKGISCPALLRVLDDTNFIANQIQHLFKELVLFNSNNNQFEFIIPVKDQCFPPICINHYAFLIGTLTNNPNSKVHIIYKISKKENDTYDFSIIDQIDEFVTNMTENFNSFFNNNFPDLLIRFDLDHIDCINFVKQFEEPNLSEIVKNLLLHRELYYVDDSKEILDPYIYKLLSKYNLPTYHLELEPNKKNEIILYYKRYQEIDGAQEIIDLLESNQL